MPAATMTEQEADIVFADLEGDAVTEGFGFEGLTEDQIDQHVGTRYPGNLPQKVAKKLVTIYDTKTGEPSVVLPYMLKKLFKDFKHDDGTPMYSRRQTVTPVRGTMLCLLHPEAATRQRYDEIGLQGKTCRKANLRSQFDVDRHMQARHKDEYAMVVRAETQEREAEEREFRRVQMEFMRSQIAGPAPAEDTPGAYPCDECGTQYSTPAALGSHRRVHKGV